jgi:4-amino-4-deoxy-L-arabinose transferase
MKYFLITVLLIIFVYFLPLNRRPMTLPDETRYAEISREMVASGDWIVPRLDGLRYFEKPVLGYWLTAVSIKLFGEHAFSVRLPSAMATGFTAIALLLFIPKNVARYFTGFVVNEYLIAFLAAVILLTSVEVFAVGTFAVLDSPLSLFITLAMIFFFSAFTDSSTRRKNVFLILCGISCGAAFLIKGFVAVAIPVVSIIPFLVIEKRSRDIIRLGWVPLLSAILVVLPWAVLIHIREPDFWRYFVFVEHIQRFFAPLKGAQHPEPLWYFIPVVLLGFIPWTFIMPAAVTGLCEKNEQSPFMRFVLCWIIFPFIMLSLSKGKLGTYVLPLYPPLAIATSLGLVNYLNRNTAPLLRRGAFISAAFGIVILGMLVFGQQFGFKAKAIFAEDEKYKLALAIGAAAWWIVVASISAAIRHIFARFLIYAATPIIMMISVPFVLPNRMLHDEKYLPEALIRRNMCRIGPESRIFSDAEDTPAICWQLKRSDVAIIGSGGELLYGLKYKDSKDRFISRTALLEKIRTDHSGRNILIEETDDIEDLFSPSSRFFSKDIEDAFVIIQF